MALISANAEGKPGDIRQRGVATSEYYPPLFTAQLWRIDGSGFELSTKDGGYRQRADVQAAVRRSMADDPDIYRATVIRHQHVVEFTRTLTPEQEERRMQRMAEGTAKAIADRHREEAALADRNKQAFAACAPLTSDSL